MITVSDCNKCGRSVARGVIIKPMDDDLARYRVTVDVGRKIYEVQRMEGRLAIGIQGALLAEHQCGFDAKPCKWTYNDEGWHTTDCGEEFSVEGGSVGDNNMIYCTYCGKVIEEVIE